MEINILYAGVGNGGVEYTSHGANYRSEKWKWREVKVYCGYLSVQMKEQFFVAAQKVGILATVQEYNLKRLEDYRPPSVDLAIVSHVMYYVETWDNVLLKLAAAVREREGVVLLTHQSEQSDNFQIIRNILLVSIQESRNIMGKK